MTNDKDTSLWRVAGILICAVSISYLMLIFLYPIVTGDDNNGFGTYDQLTEVKDDSKRTN